ncbi:MAG: hypothetical protein GC191_05685 [Azospirillum sp.]|nr:hypothetical protein [Azospirillum sp.]
MTPDGVLGILRPPKPSKVHFAVGDLLFQVSVAADGDASVCQIWTAVGHVPYTAQSPERRNAVLAILRRTQRLPHARFVIDNGQRILVLSERRVEGPFGPIDLIYQAVVVVQEARPFLHLLAEYL